MDLEVWLLFVVTETILCLTPGPAVLFVVSHGLARGGRASLAANAGILTANAVYFALYDFDRAVALSSQFERREIRMMAQLKLAQGVLEGPPKKPLFANDEQ